MAANGEKPMAIDNLGNLLGCHPSDLADIPGHPPSGSFIEQRRLFDGHQVEESCCSLEAHEGKVSGSSERHV